MHAYIYTAKYHWNNFAALTHCSWHTIQVVIFVKSFCFFVREIYKSYHAQLIYCNQHSRLSSHEVEFVSEICKNIIMQKIWYLLFALSLILALAQSYIATLGLALVSCLPSDGNGWALTYIAIAVLWPIEYSHTVTEPSLYTIL